MFKNFETVYNQTKTWQAKTHSDKTDAPKTNAECLCKILKYVRKLKIELKNEMHNTS